MWKSQTNRIASATDSSTDSLLAQIYPNPLLNSAPILTSLKPRYPRHSTRVVSDLAINKKLKRLTLASTGLTSNGVSLLASALTTSPHPLHTLDLGASQTTKAHYQKYFAAFETYDKFLKSEDLRFLRNSPDFRFIGSVYRTQDKRLGLPMDEQWKEGNETWKLITDDAEMCEKRLASI